MMAFDPSTGPREMNSVFSNTHTQYGADWKCQRVIQDQAAGHITSGLFVLRFLASRILTVSLPFGGATTAGAGVGGTDGGTSGNVSWPLESVERGVGDGECRY
jgi:hypothetical protein